MECGVWSVLQGAKKSGGFRAGRWNKKIPTAREMGVTDDGNRGGSQQNRFGFRQKSERQLQIRVLFGAPTFRAHLPETPINNPAPHTKCSPGMGLRLASMQPKREHKLDSRSIYYSVVTLLPRLNSWMAPEAPNKLLHAQSWSCV